MSQFPMMCSVCLQAQQFLLTDNTWLCVHIVPDYSMMSLGCLEQLLLYSDKNR